MTFNYVKLGRAVILMKHLASIVSLIFRAKTLIYNNITFPESNLSYHAEPVKNEPASSIYKKNIPIFLFIFYLSLLNVNISRGYN